MARRSGLGRGIGALIPTDLLDDGEASLTVFREIPIVHIEPNRFQPRDHFSEESLAALADSIRVVGVLQPILVRPLEHNRFELIAGERRWRAARRAGLAVIPAIVRPVADNESLEQALVENLHRADLNALEEAAAYQQLGEDFELSHEEIGQRVGKSRSAVANTLRLLQLSPSVQRHLIDGRLTAGHARALLGSSDRAFQEALCERVVQDSLTVRQVEEVVRSRTELEGQLADEAVVMAQPSAPRPARELPPAGLLELEHLLADYLDTLVRVKVGRGRGRITIDFATVEDLERIYRLIAEGAVPLEGTQPQG